MTTVRRTSSVTRFGALLLIVFTSTNAHAGRGKFTPGVNEPTTVSMTIHLTFELALGRPRSLTALRAQSLLGRRATPR